MEHHRGSLSCILDVVVSESGALEGAVPGGAAKTQLDDVDIHLFGSYGDSTGETILVLLMDGDFA